MTLEQRDEKQRNIAQQVLHASTISVPEGYEAIIKSSRFGHEPTNIHYYGFHFEKAGTYNIGDIIDNGGGIISVVEDIV